MSDIREAFEIVDRELRQNVPSGGSEVVRAWGRIKAALQSQTAPAVPVEVGAALKIINQALALPAKPLPDPVAHSHEAYARALHEAFCATRFKLMNARDMLAAAPQPDHIVDANKMAAMVREIVDMWDGPRYALQMKPLIDRARKLLGMSSKMSSGGANVYDHSPDAGKVVADGYCVITLDGTIDYVASKSDLSPTESLDHARRLCHEHINEAISANVEGSEKWVVRPLTIGSTPAADGGEVEPLGYLTNQAVARLQSDKRLNGEHLYAFKPDDMSKFQAVYLGPAVKESLTAAHPDQPHKDVQAQSLFDFANEIVAGHHPGMNEKHVPGVRAAAQFVANAKRLRSNGGDD